MVGEFSGRGMIALIARVSSALILSRFVSHKLVMFLARPNQRDLSILCDLMSTGKVVPVIDKRYPLSEVSQAIRYLDEKHARGKVIIIL
jgi:NADPH:quinone reductase-like Zn-dependent oxidoreductase